MSWWSKPATDSDLEDSGFTLEEETHPYDCECAWCVREQGEDFDEGSHGICDYHSNQVYERYRARKSA